MTNLFSEDYVKELVSQSVEKGEEYINNQKYADAEAILKQTLRVDPDCEKGIRVLCQLLMGQQRGSEAIPYYERLLEIRPDDYEALNNVALCYSSGGDVDSAIEKLSKCLVLYPNIPAGYWNLAIQYKEKGDHGASKNIYEKGIKRLPDDPDIRYNYAIGLAEQFSFEEAAVQYRKAIELRPDFASAHFNLSLLYLQIGNYEEGWKGYDWRFKQAKVFGKFKERVHGPEWDGGEGVGKTILVYNEQGAGDAIQFSRYLKKVKERGFNVVLEVPYELVDLLSGCEGVDKVVALRSKKTPEYDCHVSIGSLPRVLGEYEPYWDGVYVNPTGSGEKAFESYAGVKKIGICWAGNPVHRNDKNRSCRLKYFKPLKERAKLFSIQKDSRPRFWAGEGVVDLTEGCTDMGVVDLSDLLIDFNYTAAIMKCMDHVVTVDSAVAHLAGAMGLPCHLLLPHIPDFRWGLGERTKWYPSVKLVRQKVPGDYESSIREIAEEL